MDMRFTRFLFRLYDRVIFYTEQAMDWAVDSNLLPKEKAFFASNTLDTDEIWEHYNFQINKSENKVILFIGRLIQSKRVDLIFTYYKELRKHLPELQLIIIGDGPEAPIVKSMINEDGSITWLGAVVDEGKIAYYMRRTHLVFIPGSSGLSIVHALCYGKPYATIQGKHGPEFAHLEDNVNGLVLEGHV